MPDVLPFTLRFKKILIARFDQTSKALLAYNCKDNKNINQNKFIL